MYEHTRDATPGGWMYWGEGAQPAMTAQIPDGTQLLQPWSFYLPTTPDGEPGWVPNFEWIHKRGQGVDDSTMERFAARLREIPGLAAQVDAARAAGWRKRPTIPARQLFRQPEALGTITAALDELYAAIRQRSAD